MGKLRILDMFSGLGGFSLGLERTGGFVTETFCEIDPFCRAILAKHWPDASIHDDVTTYQFKEGEADVITAGFPCQDISTAGAGTGITGSRSGLYREVIRAIRVVRPRYTIMENVAALLGRGLDTILGDLAEIGHDTEWNSIPASALGAPHRRDRIWIVAYPERIGRQGPWGCIDAIHPTPDAYREAGGLVDAFQGNALPFVCRRHDGVPAALARQRLRALGNALDPQIPELIGNAILASIAAQREAA